MRTQNLILQADSYKYSHFKQYPPGTEYVSSYIEARKGGEAVFFGLQAFLNDLYISSYDVDEANELMKLHGVPFHYDGWMSMVRKHKGNLPVRIQAVPEGTVVPQGVPMVQITNTDPEFPWLTSFLETSLLRAVWYPTTVATISWIAKRMIYDALVKSADDPDAEINFKLHDFGARGVSSGESAAIGGAAHLVNFMGTDTVEALQWLATYYNTPCAGFSIPAAEHSTITAWGRGDGELDAYRNMLTAFPKSPLVAVVSDSYNIYRACDDLWGGVLKEKVERLGSAGRTLVIRPDSGDPLPTLLRVFEILFDRFGYVTNAKGYKLLPKYLRVIQGDGINEDSLHVILNGLLAAGISISNIAFGMGGGLLQKCNRDTLSFAMKASQVTVLGEKRDIYKSPIDDSGKRSKSGRFAVAHDYLGNGKLVCLPEADNVGNILQDVYVNGDIRSQYSLQDIRENAWQIK